MDDFFDEDTLDYIFDDLLFDGYSVEEANEFISNMRGRSKANENTQYHP